MLCRAGIWTSMHGRGSGAEGKVCICLQIAGLPEDITGSTAASRISLSVHKQRRRHKHKTQTRSLRQRHANSGKSSVIQERLHAVIAIQAMILFIYLYSARFIAECFQSIFFFSCTINCFRFSDTRLAYEYMNIYSLRGP